MWRVGPLCCGHRPTQSRKWRRGRFITRHERSGRNRVDRWPTRERWECERRRRKRAGWCDWASWHDWSRRQFGRIGRQHQRRGRRAWAGRQHDWSRWRHGCNRRRNGARRIGWDGQLWWDFRFGRHKRKKRNGRLGRSGWQRRRERRFEWGGRFWGFEWSEYGRRYQRSQ